MHRPASKVRRKSLKMGKIPSSNALNIKELAKGVNPLSDPSLRKTTKEKSLSDFSFFVEIQKDRLEMSCVFVSYYLKRG